MLQPASLFTDGAVLCRRKEIRVFGAVGTGQTVTVTLRNAQGQLLATGVAGEREGRFCALLAPQEACTGCMLTFQTDMELCTVADVAIGDVYLAGGQSNMELELRNAREGPDCIRTHADALLRFFNVPRWARLCPEQRQALSETRWEAVAPGRGGANSAVAYFFARSLRKAHPEVPVGIIGCYWGGTSITCWLDEETLRTSAEGCRYLAAWRQAGGDKSMQEYLTEEKQFTDTLAAWNGQVDAYKAEHPDAAWPDIAAACGPCPWNPPAGPGSPYRPAGLVTPMLSQVAPAALTGILFYQGEEDTGRTDRYDELMVLLVRRWRALFQAAELPFLFVQLPMWLDFGAEDTFRWPLIRLQQAAVRDALRNTGMVCLLDEGEYGNIHPTAKRVVGERLAGLALQLVYGEAGEQSPRALSKRTEGDCLIVELSAPAVTKDQKPPRLLEIAGEDECFQPAQAAVSGREVRLRAEGVPHPAQVRYAWTDYSDLVNLFGENGLPVEPFRL